MGNCNCNPFGIDRDRSSRKISRKIVLLLVGLDNSGKTSAAKSLIGESVDTVVPTVGFSVISLLHRGYSVMIYDLGGGPQIRDIWHRYFTDVHGVIFVIDASDVARLGEGKDVLTKLLANEKVAGKPVLVLANKQDRDGALDELDIVERFDLDALVNRHKCRTLVETCSTNQGKKRHLDPAIHNGYVWLMKSIIDDYAQLNERVESDMARQKELDDREKRERRERITKLRAERGETPDVREDEGEQAGDPFQPIDRLAAMTDKMADNHEASIELKLGRVILVEESPHKINNVRESPHEINNVKESPPRSAPARRDPFLVPAPLLDVDKTNGVNVSITEFVKEQLELERMNAQRKKRVPLRRANKTAPASPSPGSAGGSRRGSRENALCVQSPSRSTKSPSSPLKKPTQLPPLKGLNHSIEGHWTLPPLAPNPDLSWAIVTDTNAEKATNHQNHKEDLENIIKG